MDAGGPDPQPFVEGRSLKRAPGPLDEEPDEPGYRHASDGKWYPPERHYRWYEPKPPQLSPYKSVLIPGNRAEWVAFVASAAVGIVIWIPTMATRPLRNPADQGDLQQATEWLVPLLLLATLILSVVFASRWSMVAPGLIAPQLLLAPFTTPRGDEDGLWVMIFPTLVFFFLVLYLEASLVSRATSAIRDRRSRRP